MAKLGALDVITSSHKINVLYAHMVSKELGGLVAHIDALLSGIVAPEQRPFLPHITLARVKLVHDRMYLLREINRCKVAAIDIPVDRVVLKQSIITPQGPVYSDIAYYSLT
jgi:2'-5' RNA ligase